MSSNDGMVGIESRQMGQHRGTIQNENALPVPWRHGGTDASFEHKPNAKQFFSEMVHELKATWLLTIVIKWHFCFGILLIYFSKKFVMRFIVFISVIFFTILLKIYNVNAVSISSSNDKHSKILERKCTTTN